MTVPAAYILDTNVMVWWLTGDRRLSRRARELALDENAVFVSSAVTAWEFADLELRGRLPDGVRLKVFLDRYDCAILDFPASLWRRAEALPQLHLDPVDRMVVAHALETGYTLVTGDKTMRRYPVETFW